MRSWNRELRIHYAARQRRARSALATPVVRCVQIAMLVTFLASCRQEMADQGRIKPLEETDFFEDGTTARPVPAGAIARGHLNDDEHLVFGRVNGQVATTFPFPITRETLTRGRE